MRHWILILFAVMFLVGCSNADSSDDSSLKQSDNQRYKTLMDKYDAQTAQADAQLARATKQAERYDALLKRWDEQADRYDAILEKWEAQLESK